MDLIENNKGDWAAGTIHVKHLPQALGLCVRLNHCSTSWCWEAFHRPCPDHTSADCRKTHTPTEIGCHARHQPARQEHLEVGCLAQGHFDPPRGGSYQQLSNCLTA
ncbi:hypothetical protein COCON_G00181360 [Conger conger]|uniref:Uncharacterized protein n=1 Tax=Conger conger TaxID=82655 RepID=A0A9Q1HT52_CONCO|nr:hypothetical protein COCON_G00181360 [Conger conger]